MRANRPSSIRTLFQCAAVRGEISRSIASSVSLLSVPTELAEHVVDPLQGAAGVLQRDDGVVEGRRLLLVRDLGDLGLVLGKGPLIGRHEMLRLDRANGGAPNGVVQVSKNGFQWIFPRRSRMAGWQVSC